MVSQPLWAPPPRCDIPQGRRSGFTPSSRLGPSDYCQIKVLKTMALGKAFHTGARICLSGSCVPGLASGRDLPGRWAR